MTKDVRIRGIRRKHIDEDKLALAFLMLAKVISEQRGAEPADTPSDEPERGESEAA